jgi:hypothetical protein
MSKLTSSYDLKNNAAFADSHIVIAVVEALAAFYVSFTQWRGRRRTQKALAELDDRQLRISASSATVSTSSLSPGGGRAE